jgi:hypothetical protein
MKLPTKDERLDAAREREDRREAKAIAKREAEEKAKRDADAELYAIADALLKDLGDSVVSAIHKGKTCCYVRYGAPRGTPRFPAAPQEPRLGQILLDRINAVDGYTATLDIEVVPYVDKGYGCDREMASYFPAIRVRWV